MKCAVSFVLRRDDGDYESVVSLAETNREGRRKREAETQDIEGMSFKSTFIPDTEMTTLIFFLKI